MAKVSEILRFILPRSQANINAFNDLRRRVATKGLAKTQYFGYVLQNEGIPKSKPENQMCWYIEWPEMSGYRKSEEFKTELSRLAEGKARSLRFELTETKPGEVVKGLESNACEFAIINLTSEAPRFKPEFEQSMHKTFTDVYFAKGFTGGGWSYAINSNDAEGVDVESEGGQLGQLEETERKLAYYVIGWDSIADHDAFEQTGLFNVEIDKLMPYFGPGTGAFYVKFEK